MGAITIELRINGDPKPQPRARAFFNKALGQVRMYEKGTAEEWKGLVAATALAQKPPQPSVGPVIVELTFIFQRPMSHFRTWKNAGRLKAQAPMWHYQKPDRDNLEKAVLDALKPCGYWHDDCQVCRGEVIKRWAMEGELPGAKLKITLYGVTLI